MRKASEPADDIGMFLGILEVLRIAGAAEQFDAAQLVGQIFRMHEWQIQKLQEGSFNAFIGAAGERAVDDLKRVSVA